MAYTEVITLESATVTFVYEDDTKNKVISMELVRG